MAGLTWHSRIARLNWALRELTEFKNPSFERTIGAAKCLESFNNYVRDHPGCEKNIPEDTLAELQRAIDSISGTFSSDSARDTYGDSSPKS
jgi:hypothetical protein